MTSSRRYNKFVFSLLVVGLFIFGLIVVLSTNVMAQDVQQHSVLLNSENSTKEMSKEDLTQIYLGAKQRWDDGTKIKLAVLKPGQIDANLISEKLANMNAHEFSKYWLAMVFQGRVSAPKYFISQDAIIAYVNSHRTAIGICNSKFVGGNNVLIVDGEEEF
jgi:hypothetical protein